MTLNSVIGNRRVILISPNSVNFGADYVKVVEDTVATSAFTAWYRGSCSCPASEHEPPRAGHGADATVPV